MPEIGLAITEPSGRLSRKTVLARARSVRVNQWRIRTRVEVSTPPSATPSRKRLTISSFSVRTRAVDAEIAPHTSNRPKITHFALQTEESRPAGICNTT